MVNEKSLKNIFKGWQFSVSIATLFLGFILALQFKSQADLRASAASIPSRRIEELSSLLKNAEEEINSLESSISLIRNEISNLKEKKIGTKNDSNSEMKKDKLIMTGFVPLTGKGLELFLDDSKKPLEQADNPNNFILHNEDLLKITNELYASGAEAISINGNRLIANSEITCAGPTILVNKNRIVPPFQISVIGNPETMMATLEMRGGIVEYLKFFGIEIKTEVKDNVFIPAYNGSLNFKYSKPENYKLKKEDKV